LFPRVIFYYPTFVDEVWEDEASLVINKQAATLSETTRESKSTSILPSRVILIVITGH